MQIVIFKLNDEQYAFNSSKVKNIVENMNITKVPKAPKYVVGLINLRGNIITMLDLSVLLNIEKSKNEQNNIIIINRKDELVGIKVDEVEEVLEIDNDMINTVGDTKDKSYIKGVIKLNDNRIVTLIDVDEFELN